LLLLADVAWRLTNYKNSILTYMHYADDKIAGAPRLKS
jgi:hypothetical protein